MLLVAEQDLLNVLNSAELRERIVSQFAVEISPLAEARTEEPRESRFGFCSSEICFSLGKRYGIEPQALAETVAELFSSDSFTLTVAGGGYLNFFPTESGILSFLSGEIEFNPPALTVDWESRHLKRVYTPELLTLRSTLTTSREGSLQLLAMLGDPEISVTPYLKGFGGSENVPWYLERYFKICKELGSCHGVRIYPTLTRLRRTGSDPYEGSGSSLALPLQNFFAGWSPLPPLAAGVRIDPDPINAMLEDLLVLRGRLMRDFTQARGERVLRSLLLSVKIFFSIYNRPEIRLALDTPDDETGRVFCYLAQIQSRIVGESLSKVEFPTEVVGKRADASGAKNYS
jgi:hypothetical protein